MTSYSPTNIRLYWLIVCATPAFAMLASSNAFAVSALDVWDNAARAALPTHIKIWLGSMVLCNLASIAFLKSYVAPRWVLAGFVLSHVAGAVVDQQSPPLIAGQVSLLHAIFWTPGIIVLLLRRREMQLPSAYGVWVCAIVGYYLVSMFFDVPDAIEFLQHS